jgi:RND family efflux transporter MFP subunit
LADRSSSSGRQGSGRTATLTLAALALAAALPACRRTAESEEIVSAEVPTIQAATATVTRRELVERLVVRGTIVAPPNEDVRIASQVAGRVVAMNVAEGDRVAAGQALAQIETQPLLDQRRAAAAALGQAKAALDAAERNLSRTESLFERGIAAGKEVEETRAARAAAEAGLEAARTALEAADRALARAQVTSPISGQVVRRFVGVGEQVDGTAAQPLVEVANIERVEAAAQVPAEHLGAVRAGMSAEVSSDAYPGRSFGGRVVAIAPALDPATNSALVRVAVANPELLLKVGMFAEVQIALSRKPGALSVPPAALVRGADGAAVYAVEGDLATRTPVGVGLETAEAVEVVSGVKEGQTVLVSSVHGLAEKARLTAKP